MNDITRSPRHQPTQAILLGLLFAVEALVFYRQVALYIAPYYPPNFDQLSYYLATYDLIHTVQTKGLRALWDELMLPNSATGTTFVLQGALLSFIGGTNRTSLLSLNFIYLIILQLVFFQTVRERTRDVSTAWIGLAILVSLATLFLRLGGVYDYRIDFSALCLYGVWCCLVLWSDTFRSTKGTFAVGAVAVLLILSRFFTIIYVGAVFGGLLIAALYTLRFSTSASRRRITWIRIRNILISGVVVLMICLARLFISWQAIYNYYVVGHMLGEERFIRAHELGVYTLLDHLLYYPHSIVMTHIGFFALWLGGATLGISLLISLLRRQTHREVIGSLRRYSLDFLTLSLSVLVPLIVLTTNIAKSPVVGGIVVVPIALAVTLLCAAILPRRPLFIAIPRWLRSLRREQPAAAGLRLSAAAVIAVITMGAGLQHFLAQNANAKPPAPLPELEKITLLAEAIAQYTKDNNLKFPTMSSDRIVDYQNVGTVKLFSIERLRTQVEINPKFGHGAHGIFATSREDALRLFAESDIIVMTDSVTDRVIPYPMNTKIKEYWDELWQWTNTNRALIYQTNIFGVDYRVFVRPMARMSKLSAGWVTADGLDLHVDPHQLSRFPHIVLGGTANFTVLGGAPLIEASAIGPDGKASAKLPVRFEHDGQKYQITVDGRPAVAQCGCAITLHLDFDRFFVPSALGINSDTRKLVFAEPTTHDLRLIAN